MAADAGASRRAGRRFRPRHWLAAVTMITPPLRYAATVHSVPPEQPWRRTCPGCATPLGPLAGGSRPAGRCDGCAGRIGPPPYLLEVATGVGLLLAGIAIAGTGGSPGSGNDSLPVTVLTAMALAGWVLLAVPLAFVDLSVHRLPDRLTLPAAGWVLAWLGVAGLVGDVAAGWWRAAAAAAVCGAGFGLVSLLLGSRGYGLGDAKLAVSVAALLAWYGWAALLTGLFLAFLGSALVALVLLVTSRVGWRDPLPFGPFLVAGALVALAWVGIS